MTALPKLYVQCNPLLDISAPVSEAFIAKYKVERGAASLVTDEQMPIYADLEAQSGMCYVPGGSGLNTSRVAQWLTQAPQGTFVSYVGCVADDTYGDILTAAAQKDGVAMTLEHTTKAATGSCAVCVIGKERSLVANLAAANCLSSEHMKSPAVVEALKASKLFYLTGFTLTVDAAHVLTVAEAARAAEGIFMMNLSAPFIMQFFSEQFEKVLPYIDTIFSNEDEARALAKARGWATEDVAEIAKKAAAELPYTGTADRLVVFTQGSEPTVFATKSGQSGTVAVPAIDAASIIDTNGAGDSFVGGFLAGLASGKPIARCCEVGHYAAGVVIQHDGCTYPSKPSIAI